MGYSYHYFQCFHLGLVGLGLEREYFLLYGFWVCKARLCSVLLCLLTAFGLPLLFQRIWEQAVALGGAVGRKRLLRLRIAASLGGPVGLLLLFIILYQLGAWTGQAAFAREQHGDFPSYARVKVRLKDKQDEQAAAWAEGCHRLLLRSKDRLYLFRPDGVSERLPTEIVPNSEVKTVRLLPSYQTPDECRD